VPASRAPGSYIDTLAPPFGALVCPHRMSVLLEDTSLQASVTALEKKVVALTAEVRRLQTRLQAVERARPRPAAHTLGFAPHADDGEEDVQCTVS